MRTEVEALKEIRDRLSYFCARLDGKYDPPWVTEVIGIIDDVLIKPHRKDSARVENNMAAHEREKVTDCNHLNGAKVRDALELASRVIHGAIAADILKGDDAQAAFFACRAALAAPSEPIGNAAKMRKALIIVYDWILKAGNVYGYPDNEQKRRQLFDMMTKALSALPRNCDRFASAEEAWDAYDEWVESYRAKGETEPLNEFGWLFAKAKGENDGSK